MRFFARSTSSALAPSARNLASSASMSFSMSSIDTPLCGPAVIEKLVGPNAPLSYQALTLTARLLSTTRER